MTRLLRRRYEESTNPTCTKARTRTLLRQRYRQNNSEATACEDNGAKKLSFSNGREQQARATVLVRSFDDR
jgi:hypothetical protein